MCKSGSSFIHYSNSGNFYIFVINNNQSFISQILKVVDPLGEKFDFSTPWDLKFKAILSGIYINQVPLSQSFKSISNEKSLIHGRETATI